MLTRFGLWLRSLLFRRRLEREMAEEFDGHMANAVARLMADGMSEAEARRAARLEFGNLSALKDAARDVRGGRGLDSVMADVRFGLRHLARTPWLTAVMVLMFALGIGINGALFAVIRGFTEGGLPGVPKNDAVVRIRGIEPRAPGRATGREFTYSEYREHAAQTQLFGSVAAWTSADVVIDVGGRVEQLESGAATFVTSNYFSVLGLSARFGSGLPAGIADTDVRTSSVAVVSHVIWERHFDRATDIAGRTIKVNGVPVTIAGVAPRRFAGARTGGSQMRVWLPLSARQSVLRTVALLPQDDEAVLGIVARLQPGVRAEDATPTVAAVGARSTMAATSAREDARVADVVPLLANNYFPPPGGPPEPTPAGRSATLIFPLLVLSITCTSVSALLAGLAVRRRREIAVRLAMGAARPRIVRQLLTESVLLALAGGIVGLFAIWVSLRVFDSRIPDIEILIDWPVMLFVFGVATVAGLLFGISPALHATRLSVGEVLKNSSEGVIAGRLRLQSLLVVAQIALTQPVLLALGALVLEVRGELREVPRSAYADRLIELHYNMNPRYGAMDARREAGVERAKESLSRLPGVTSVVRMPSRDLLDVRVHPADRAPAQDIPDLLILDGHAADAGYFELTGRSFVRGRDFDGAQRDSAGAIVIGSTLARRLWGAADPVGRRFVPAFSQTDVPATYTVVGVIDDDATAPAADQRPRVFIPPRGATEHLLIRTHGPADELLGQVRSAAHAAAPELPVTFATTLASSEAAMRRLYLRGIYAVGTGGGLALLLSAIGLYAVVAFSVGQRIREIGIRAALGASNRQVVRLFVRRGMVLGVIGLVIGSILSIVGARLLALALGEEPATGLFALSAVVGAIVLCVAFLATWLPARSALRVDPINVLRAE